MPPSIPPMAVHAYLHAILQAANSLLRSGMEVVAFQADIVTRQPVLWIKDTPKVRNLARCGFASYDRTGSDATGSYRIGVFECLGVTVQWLERV